MPEIHVFDTTWDAYNGSQAGYYKYPEGPITLETVDQGVWTEVEDGDILSVPSEGVHGFLWKAWPIAFTEAHGEFGRPKDQASWWEMQNDYPETFRLWEEMRKGA